VPRVKHSNRWYFLPSHARACSPCTLDAAKTNRHRRFLSLLATGNICLRVDQWGGTSARSGAARCVSCCGDRDTSGGPESSERLTPRRSRSCLSVRRSARAPGSRRRSGRVAASLSRGEDAGRDAEERRKEEGFYWRDYQRWRSFLLSEDVIMVGLHLKQQLVSILHYNSVYQTWRWVKKLKHLL